MIRFLSFMLGKPYETCKSCETLKQQLAFVNDEKKQLTETLLKIVSPKTIEAPPVELNQVAQTSALFSRRRAALEERDRQEAKILNEGRHLGKPDNLKNVNLVNKSSDESIEKLEQELNIPEKAQGE